MLGWLKKKAAQQSLFNVELNTACLIVDASRADAALVASGGQTNPADINRVKKSQQALLNDIGLAIANGATLEDVQARINKVRAKHPSNQGADMAIVHVLQYASRAVQAY
ncbi:MAG: hypothetical protein KIS96_06805 [Bauldia sp.]|nr:hypothetical protein [Bauldia sp.]